MVFLGKLWREGRLGETHRTFELRLRTCIGKNWVVSRPRAQGQSVPTSYLTA